MRVTSKMLGEAIMTANELAVVKRTSPLSFAKWQAFVVKAVATQPDQRTESQHRAIALAKESENEKI